MGPRLREDDGCACVAILLLLHHPGLRLGLQRLRIEADIENVGIVDIGRHRRIDDILRDYAEWHAQALAHRYRGPDHRGGDGLLVHAALHYRDAQGYFDRGRRAGRSDNYAALDSDPCGDLAAAQIAVTRGAGDGRLRAAIPKTKISINNRD
jgi:hypothetical protein